MRAKSIRRIALFITMFSVITCILYTLSFKVNRNIFDYTIDKIGDTISPTRKMLADNNYYSYGPHDIAAVTYKNGGFIRGSEVINFAIQADSDWISNDDINIYRKYIVVITGTDKNRVEYGGKVYELQMSTDEIYEIAQKQQKLHKEYLETETSKFYINKNSSFKLKRLVNPNEVLIGYEFEEVTDISEYYELASNTIARKWREERFFKESLVMMVIAIISMLTYSLICVITLDKIEIKQKIFEMVQSNERIVPYIMEVIAMRKRLICVSLLVVMCFIGSIKFGNSLELQTKDSSNSKDAYDISNEQEISLIDIRPDGLDEVLKANHIYSNYYNDYKLKDNERKYHEMTVEEMSDVIDTTYSISSSKEELINTVGKRMAAGLCRLRENYSNSNAVVTITKPIFISEEIDINNKTYSIYKSDIIHVTQEIGSLFIIENNETNNVDYMSCIEHIGNYNDFDGNEVAISFEINDISNINKVVYKIPMFEYSQHIGGIQLPICNAACLTSFISSYCDKVIEPLYFTKAFYPVHFDQANGIQNIDSKLLSYDSSIYFRDFTGISQYAVKDIVKNTVLSSEIIDRNGAMGNTTGLISKIKSNIPVMITVIENEYSYRNVNGKVVNQPDHIMMCNGYIDNDIIVGFNPSEDTSGIDSERPGIIMFWGNGSKNSYLSDIHIVIPNGDTNHKLYSINDIIYAKSSITHRNNQNTLQNDLDNLGSVIDYEYKEGYKNNKNSKSESDNKNIIEHNKLVSTLESTGDGENNTKLTQYEVNNNIIKNTINSVIKDQFELDDNQISRFSSGYTDYAYRLVQKDMIEHQEKYIYMIICKLIESVYDDSGSIVKDIDISMFDCDLSINRNERATSNYFMKQMFMIRKHPSLNLNTDIKSIVSNIDKYRLVGIFKKQDTSEEAVCIINYIEKEGLLGDKYILTLAHLKPDMGGFNIQEINGAYISQFSYDGKGQVEIGDGYTLEYIIGVSNDCSSLDKGLFYYNIGANPQLLK